MNIMGRIKTNTKKAWLAPVIYTKWLYDRYYLPLTTEHFELYNIIHKLCWRKLGRFPNLKNCNDFNDRIQWLKLFDQSHEIIRCSDKILVRDYISERVGAKYLVKMYQTHNHFSEINFDTLPDSFVIKTNHDSGTVILVRDKKILNYSVTGNKIETALAKPYGWEKGEWAYSYINPKVLIEEFIEPENPAPPPDYKFYCVEGSVKFMHFIFDRGQDTKEQTLDRDGNDLTTPLHPSFKLSHDFVKPNNWEEMVWVAERLGKAFKCVRVDLYRSGKSVYVGELTFWPMTGCYKGEGQRVLSKFLNFDRTTFKPPIVSLVKNRHNFRSRW